MSETATVEIEKRQKDLRDAIIRTIGFLTGQIEGWPNRDSMIRWKAYLEEVSGVEVRG